MAQGKLLADLLQDKQLQSASVSSLALDSRTVKPGALFFAYPGVTQDGRKYIAEAIAQGAQAIVYESGDGFCYTDKTQALLIPYKNLQAALGLIAARFYDEPSQALNIIGVTGTNGKTSVTHFLAQAFAQHHVACGLIGTLGNGVLPTLKKPHHTTPNPIELQHQLAQFVKQGVSHVAMEVSSHALDQHRVVGTAFSTAIFTQLSRDHLDYHVTVDAYARAKEQLFAQPGLTQAVINYDDEQGRRWIEKYQNQLTVVAYSLKAKIAHKGLYVTAQEISAVEQGYELALSSSWGEAHLILPMIGEFNISNVLAVLATLLLNNLPLEKAVTYCAKLVPVKGRMQLFGAANQPKVVVDYAHTPDALAKTLAALRSHCRGKLWCVFGCGGDRDRGKRPQMAQVAEKLSDYIVITDDNPRHEAAEAIVKDIQSGFSQPQQVKVILNRAIAIQTVVQNAKINDIVLIAGKGHEAMQIIGDETFPFDDAVQVKAALAKR